MIARTISIVSRVRRTGRSKRTPCQPSITCGPLVPMPSTKRPPDRACSDCADIASIAGVRAPSCTMPVPSRIVDVSRGEVRQRGERVAGPELGHPHRVDAEPLGLADELDGLGSERHGADADAQRHRVASASCLMPSTVRCMLARTSSRRRRSTRASLPGLAAMAIVVPDGPGPMT